VERREDVFLQGEGFLEVQRRPHEGGTRTAETVGAVLDGLYQQSGGQRCRAETTIQAFHGVSGVHTNKSHGLSSSTHFLLFQLVIN
jgi:hypothetical protein